MFHRGKDNMKEYVYLQFTFVIGLICDIHPDPSVPKILHKFKATLPQNRKQRQWTEVSILLMTHLLI